MDKQVNIEVEALKPKQRGLFFSALVISVASPLFTGWVISVLWNWFATPLGAPRVGLFLAAGLYLLIMFVHQCLTEVSWHKAVTTSELWHKACESGIHRLLCLGVGAVINYFM